MYLHNDIQLGKEGAVYFGRGVRLSVTETVSPRIVYTALETPSIQLTRRYGVLEICSVVVNLSNYCTVYQELLLSRKKLVLLYKPGIKELQCLNISTIMPLQII